MRLKINLGTNSPPQSDWDNLAPNSVGVISAGLTDYDTATVTDIALINQTNAWTATSSGALTDQDHWGVPERVWDNNIQLSIATANTLVYEGFDLIVGRQYFFSYAGAAPQARSTAVNVNGVTGNYVNTAQSVPIKPPRPTQLLVTATDNGSGQGELVVVHSGSSAFKVVQFHEITDGIGLVNDDDTVKIGQVNEWGVAGFVPDAATIGATSATAVDADGFTFPALANGVESPDYGLQTLTATATGESASKQIRVFPQDGYHYTRIRNISNNVEGNIRYYIADLELDDTITLQNGNELDPPVLVNTVTNDGFIRTDYVGTQTIYRRKLSTGFVTAYQLITSASESGGGITVIGLTSTGLSMTGLVAVGL